MRFSIKSALQFNHLIALCALHVTRCSKKVLSEVEDWVRWCCNEPYIVAEFGHVLRKLTKFLMNILEYWIIGACKIEWSMWATVVAVTSAKPYLSLIDAVLLLKMILN